jgi:hypothetical protein
VEIAIPFSNSLVALCIKKLLSEMPQGIIILKMEDVHAMIFGDYDSKIALEGAVVIARRL